MKLKKFNLNVNKLSDVIFFMGTIASIAGFYLIYKERIHLPEGVCPINENKYLIILGIILLVISIILPYIGKFIKK